MYRNVVTEMSRDRNGQTETTQTETARPKSPVPVHITLYPVYTTKKMTPMLRQQSQCASFAARFLFT